MKGYVVKIGDRDQAWAARAASSSRAAAGIVQTTRHSTRWRAAARVLGTHTLIDDLIMPLLLVRLRRVRDTRVSLAVVEALR